MEAQRTEPELEPELEMEETEGLWVARRERGLLEVLSAVKEAMLERGRGLVGWSWLGGLWSFFVCLFVFFVVASLFGYFFSFFYEFFFFFSVCVYGLVGFIG